MEINCKAKAKARMSPEKPSASFSSSFTIYFFLKQSLHRVGLHNIFIHLKIADL